MKNTYTKYAGRKFILSLLLFGLATGFLWEDAITGGQWQTVLMVTVVSYVTGQTIADRTSSGAFRLGSLFSRRFIIAVGVVALASLMLHTGRIDGDVWLQTVIAAGGAYNLISPLSR